MSLPALAALGGLGGLLTAFGVNDLRDIGEAANMAAQDITKELIDPETGTGLTQFKPYTMTTATGGTFGAGLRDDGTMGTTLTLSQPEKTFQDKMFSSAGDFFTKATQDTGARTEDLYGQLRAIQAPEEQAQRQALEERLAAQGRLGVQTAQFGGTPEAATLAMAQERAKNEAMFGAMQQARQEQAQQAALGSQFLGQSYMPQAQMLNAIQGTSLFPQMQQQAQLYGAGQFGETMMSGVEAQLLAEQARANLIGGLGSSMLSGLFAPVATQGGGVGNILTTLFSSDVRLKDNIEKVGTVDGINLYTWDWTKEGKDIAGDQKAFGVLAQEIQQIRPSAVIEGSDGYLRVDYSKLPEVSALVEV